MNCIEGKIILITGASSGIGEATAMKLAENGAKVILCARSLDKVQKKAEEIKAKYGVDAYPLRIDVSDYYDTEKQIASLPEEWKNIDGLVNNAGCSIGSDLIWESNYEDYKQVFDTNILGCVNMVRLVLPGMISRNSGHIIYIGSVCGQQVYKTGSIYSASKWAVRALSKATNLDVNGYQIKVTLVEPGTVKSNFPYVRFKGDAERAAKTYQGFDDVLVPDDIAESILFAFSQPENVKVTELQVLSTSHGGVGMVARKNN